MAKETITQKEYEKQMRDLRLECAEEYNKLDRDMVSNQRQLEFLQAQRAKMLSQVHELELANCRIKTERNEMCRKYNLKRRELFDKVEIMPLPRELSGHAAFSVRQAVEKALRDVLAEYEGIDLEGIRCNYNYDEEGHIEFFVNIPKSSSCAV